MHKSLTAAVALAGATIISGGLVVAIAPAASAAPLSASAASVSLQGHHVAKKHAPKKHAAKKLQKRDYNPASEKKFGVINEATIAHYKLTAKDLKGIKASQKLAKTAEVQKIRYRESNGQYNLVDGQYFGAYQFNHSTWISNGGGKFASNANLAPKWAQDYIMYKTHQARGFSAWSTA